MVAQLTWCPLEELWNKEQLAISHKTHQRLRIAVENAHELRVHPNLHTDRSATNWPRRHLKAIFTHELIFADEEE